MHDIDIRGTNWHLSWVVDLNDTTALRQASWELGKVVCNRFQEKEQSGLCNSFMPNIKMSS